mmetsp:Transcript_59542/g.145906  ORF Transcript_59542/g.145906 Transcript_59542/m.145906 type:complete len:112 (+) Transcript_59542:4532-4867(+)
MTVVGHENGTVQMVWEDGVGNEAGRLHLTICATTKEEVRKEHVLSPTGSLHHDETVVEVTRDQEVQSNLRHQGREAEEVDESLCFDILDRQTQSKVEMKVRISLRIGFGSG